MSNGRTPYRWVAPSGTAVLGRSGLSVSIRSARTRVKRVLIGGYCRGLVPAFAVSFVFRLLSLRQL